LLDYLHADVTSTVLGARLSLPVYCITSL
jgi:hypothetical protein